MSNDVFLWIFSSGTELGVIVLMLLPLRAVLKKKAPRIFSYLLWCVLPINAACDLSRIFVPRLSFSVVYYGKEIPYILFYGMGVRFGKVVLMIGTVCVLITIGYLYIRLRRNLVGAIRLRDNIFITDRVKSPFSMGLIHPKIYLPSSLAEEYYVPVILHERVHISRKDIWMKHVGIVLLVVFWFQPLLWLAFYMFVNDMEEACDEAVLRRSADGFQKQYARALVEVSYNAGKIGGVAIGYGNGEIKERIEHALTYKRSNVIVRLTATIVCIAFALLAVLLSRQVPRMVRVVNEMEENVSISGMEVSQKGITEQLIPVEE